MALQALSIAATSGRALLDRIDTLAHNLANAQTVGFKRIQPVFAALEGGVRIAGRDRLFTPGPLEATRRDLDFAIEGEGFFRVRMPDGALAYTRAGHLRVDAEGKLVTPEGYAIDPPVVVPAGATRVLVSATGQVQVPDGQAFRTLGEMTLVRFVNPSGLEPAGENLYRETATSGAPQEGRPGETPGFGWIRQGYLEGSNVEIVRELTELIAAHRAFEMNAKVIESADQVLQAINNLRRDRA